MGNGLGRGVGSVGNDVIRGCAPKRESVVKGEKGGCLSGAFTPNSDDSAGLL